MLGRTPGNVLRVILTYALFCAGSPAIALERILSYHSDIEIAEDSTMTVRETIRVVAAGQQIRRGIYREFPTTYTDRYGNKVEVNFRVMEVTRDGKAEPWHKKRHANGVRIYAGSSDTRLQPGEYSYTFTYKTNRQIGFFDDHDELYWNVTGNGWGFSIARASAIVTLPSLVSSSDIRLIGYTGPQGSTSNNATASTGDSRGTIQTVQALPPGSGLTLVISWPKGFVQEPGEWQRLAYLLSDNLGLFLSLLALFGSSLYLFLMWSRYGRDPGKGVIFPHYEPPEGYSPASARYISEMGYDKETFTAAIINLAVKGHVSITCSDDDYTLKRNTCSAPLAAPEAAMINKLFRQGPVLKLDNSNHEQVSAARAAHKKALQRDYLNQYFKTNGKLLLPSLMLSIILLFVIVVTDLFVPLVFALFFCIFALHILFAYLLKAPAARGRLLMDRLEGFKLYLEVAEKDDLDLRHPPDMTPELFESYLPFAIALGVEQQWAEQFSQVFARLEAEQGAGYRPAWYHGSFSSTRMNQFTSSVSGNFSSAISSAARPPGSSSGGGGGGSSGGGGGGGGGGGW